MKKAMFYLIVIMALAMVLAGCGGGDSEEAEPAQPSGDSVAGQPLFQGTCSACHGPDAKGILNLGKDLTTSQFFKENSDDELLAFVKVGRPISDPLNTQGVDMPPKGGNPALSDEDILDIIAYLRTREE